MGNTKIVKNGSGDIVFHVGKELPQKGENFLMVPGVQNAQGRGVYFSEEIQMKYSGGEHFMKELDITPIYCVPLKGNWVRSTLKKKDNAVVYHTNGKVIDLKNLQWSDQEIDGMPVRYYFPEEIDFYIEPKDKIFDKFSKDVRMGRLEYSDAVSLLKEKSMVPELHISKEEMVDSLERKMHEGGLPEMKEFSEFKKEFLLNTGEQMMRGMRK